MGEQHDFISSEDILPSNNGEMVSIFVPFEQPLLKLKRALDWGQLEAVMVESWQKAGKNIDGGRGLSFPVSFYVRLVVLMAVKSLNSREMEQYMAESVVARVFLEIKEPLRFQIKDHSSIARAQAGLGEEGFKQVNQLIVKEAVRMGFAKREILSSDTTVQEPLIGYPHEAGILRGVAQRVARIAKKMKQKGVERAEQLSGLVKEVLKEVKHYYLFSSGAEAKEEALKEVVKVSEELFKASAEFIKSKVETSQQVVKSGIKQLGEIVEFTRELMPQIKSWLETGVVETEKLLHCGITQARAIVKNKTGKKTEFGIKWLINRISGGYVFGEVVQARADEKEMPLKGLEQYRGIFGKGATPEMIVYDRGGSAKKTVKQLKKEGVEKVAIQPKGKAEWSIVEADQQEALSQRGKTEGVIGTLKSQKYGFNQGRERSNQTLKAAGQRAMCGMNLNNLVRDLVRR
jgi:hypothetical protein